MHSRVFYVFISFKVIFIFLHIKKIGLDLVSASADMVLVVVSNHMYGFQLPLMCDINIHKTIQGTDRNSDKCLNHSWFGLFVHVYIIILLLYFLCSNHSIVSKKKSTLYQICQHSRNVYSQLWHALSFTVFDQCLTV